METRIFADQQNETPRIKPGRAMALCVDIAEFLHKTLRKVTEAHGLALPPFLYLGSGQKPQ